jgi:2-methylcitrate dehydratase
MAGFANGVMARYLDCSDSYIAQGSGHPSDMIAAVLALAEPMAADGRTVITAITLAYEVFCRLCDRAPFGKLGWDQGVFSAVGSACGAARVLGLDRAAAANAISLAVVPNLALGVTREGELSMWKGAAVAQATRSAIFAALLAREGMTRPAEPFEGPKGVWEQVTHQRVVLDGLEFGDPFRITGTSFKQFPCQIHTQGPIQLALELRAQLASSSVASVRIRTHRTAVESAATDRARWDPQTRETADHSIPYVVAVALQDGSVTPASFSQGRLRDPALRPLMSRIEVEEDASYTSRFPADAGCDMEITATDGRSFRAHLTHPRGHVRNPLDDSEVESKLQRLSWGVLSEEQCSRALSELWSFDTAGDLRRLLDCLVVSGGP